MSSITGSERVVVLVDMDCFYVQVEERDHPAIKGRPAAVVQYNTHRGGGIIAVNYEARACGVKRGMRGTDAAEACPEIQLVRVPMLRSKANLAKYRNAGKEVLDVLCQFSDMVERASIDEAYLDVTQVVDDIIKRGCYPYKTRDKISGDSKTDTEPTNSTVAPVSDELDIRSEVKDTPKCGPSEIETRISFGSLIPGTEDLPTTWVELPLADPENEIFDLGIEEQRRKYELETTALSDWTPEVASDVVQAELDVAEASSVQPANVESSVADEVMEKQEVAIAAPESRSQAPLKEKTQDEKEAERVRGLSTWLQKVHKSSSYPSNFGDDNRNGLSCDVTLNASMLSSNSNNVGNSAMINSSDALRLAVAARLCEEIRASVLKETGFKCSAGIAHNKVLAKLVCGLHKPNQQTVLPADAVDALWRRTAVRKVRNLGGKLGHSLQSDLGCETMADVSALPLAVLSSRYDDKTAKWLYELGKGRDTEPVVARQLPKSVGCSKNFLGPESLYTRTKVQEWTRALAEELSERLVEDQNLNKRVARTLTVSYRLGDKPGQNNYYGANTGSRSCPLPSYAAERIAAVTMTLLNPCNNAKQGDKWSPPLLNIGMSAGKFDDFLSSGMPSISDMFKKAELRQHKSDAGTSTSSGTGDLQRQFEGDDQSRANDEISTSSLFSEKDINTGQKVKHQNNIKKFFTSGESSSKCDPSVFSTKIDVGISNPCTSTASGSNFHDDRKEHEANPGSSFFKSFLMRKNASSSAKEEISADDSSSTSKLAKIDEDSRDALNILADELDTSDDEFPLSDELKTKQILNSSPVRADIGNSVYDVSTDDDSMATTKEIAESIDIQQTSSACGNDLQFSTLDSETKDRNTNSDLATEISLSDSDSHTMDAVSVAELFPNLDEVDESLLPHLPLGLRKAVRLALVRHKAEKAGREALNKTGIARFMKKLDSKEKRKEGIGNVSKSLQSESTDIDCTGSARQCSETNMLKYVLGNPSQTGHSANASEEFRVTSSAGPSSERSESTINIPLASKSERTEKESSTLKWDRTPTNNHHASEELAVNGKVPFLQSPADDDSCTECELCGAKIRYSEVAEHTDYHLALKLQAQLQNGTCAVGESKNLNYATSRKTTKRKMSKQPLPDSKKNKTIDSFFSK